MARAGLFDSREPPAFWAILDESLIRRPVLPPEEMAELLEHIAELVQRHAAPFCRSFRKPPQPIRS